MNILFEIDLPRHPAAWINAGPGIYAVRMSGAQINVTDDHSVTGYYPAAEDDEKVRVGSVREGVNYYSECTSLAAMYDAFQVFYFDFAEQVLYVKCTAGDAPWFYDISAGIVWGFCQTEDGTYYYDDIFYDPRLNSCGTITKKVDSLFWGIMALQSVTVGLNNADGRFDRMRDEDIFGQPARIRTEEGGVITSRFAGIVEEPSWSRKEYSLKISDKRAILSRKIPSHLFTAEEYPGVAQDMIGKAVPMLYGYRERIKCIPLDYALDDGEYVLSTGSNRFLYADGTIGTLAGAVTCYVAGVQTSFTEVNGIITINLDDTSNADSVVVDANGYTGITKALHVARDLMDVEGGYEYTDTFFDTTEWTAQEAESLTVGFLIGKDGDQVEMREAIESLCVSDSCYVYPTNDGRFTVKRFDPDAAITYHIKDHEWLDDPKFTKSAKEYLTSVNVKWGQKSEPLDGEQEWMTLAETSYEDEVFRTYKVSQTKDIETLLTTAADAQTKATNVMEQSKTVGVTVTRSLPLVYADIDIEDMITASHHRYGADREPGLYRVIGTALDLKNKKVQVTMKFIEDYVVEETEYHMEVDSGGDFIIDSDGAYLIAGL